MKYVIINRRPYRVCIYNTLINHEFLNLDYKQTGVGGVDSCVGAAPSGCPSYKQTGVGGDDSWGAKPHPEYTLYPEKYSYSFRLRPFSEGESPVQLSKQNF